MASTLEADTPVETGAPATLSADAITNLVQQQLQVALANLSANAGASASDAGPPSQLAKSKATLLSEVREIKEATAAAQEVFVNAYADKYSQRAFEGKLSLVFAAMVMQMDIALAHANRIVQLAIAGKATTDNRMSAAAVETMGKELQAGLPGPGHGPQHHRQRLTATVEGRSARSADLER